MNVSFIKSAVHPRDWPDIGELGEIAVAGRSNVGKSSLINRLCRQRQLARVSRTPGRTQLLNFFQVVRPAGGMVICDLPGYGYAKVPERIRRAWGPMVETYLSERLPLRGLLLLMDVRRDPGDWEIDLVAWCSRYGRAVVPVVTKIDKLGRAKRIPRIAAVARGLGLGRKQVVGFSALSGEGADLLWARMERTVGLVERAPGGRVRGMTSDDVEAAGGIEGQARWDFRGLLDEPHRGAWVAQTAAGRVVGYLVAQRVLDVVEILDLAVLPDQRRRGHGRRLVSGLIAWAAASGGGGIQLDVREGNAAARGLYAALGFTEVGRRKGYYQDGEDALLMDRTLRSAPDEEGDEG